LEREGAELSEGRSGREVEYVQRQGKGRKRNSGNSIAEVKGNYKRGKRGREECMRFT
jgi:hypothetical protein